MKKLFVIKKYVWATSASNALKLEKKTKADDCWIDEEFKRQQDLKTKVPMGFVTKKK